MEDEKTLAEKDRDALKLQLGGLELDLEVLKKNGDLEKKKHDELTRERDILSKNYLKACEATDKQANLVKLYQKQKLTMEQDIRMHRDEALKQRKIIYQLEKERDRYRKFIFIFSDKTMEKWPELNCSDRIKNQAETGVDCGGPCKPCGKINDTSNE